MNAYLPPMIRFQPLVAGSPLPGGKVYFYQAGTTTPQAAYAADGTTPLANPLTLDANGATDFRLGSGLVYKINLTDSVGGAVLGWPVDLISSENAAAALQADLADTSDVAKGDALIGVKQPWTGAVATTQHEMNTRVVNVFDFFSAAQKADVLAGTAASNFASALDVSDALLAAIAYCKTIQNPRLVIPSGAYKTTKTIVFDLPHYSTIEVYGTIYSDVSANTAVRLGSTTGNTNGLIVCGAGFDVRRTTYDTTSGSIGIQVRDLVFSKINVKVVINFQNGLFVNSTSGNGGVSYCQFYLGVLHDNKINLQLTASSGGYTNENIFYGGSFNHSTSFTAAYPSLATVNLQIDHYVTNILNNNRFFSPSFEDTNILAIAASINGGNNVIYHPRLENSATKNTSSFTGSLGGTALTLTSDATTTGGTGFAIGQAIVGANVTPGNYIASLTSGVLGKSGSVYALGGLYGGPVASQAMTSTDAYRIVFEANSVECAVVGNGFSYFGHNIKDLGSNNCFQTRDGWVMSAQTTSGNPLLRLQSTNSGLAHLIQLRNTSGQTKAWFNGNGQGLLADRLYAENGLRFSSVDGTLNDLGVFVGTGTPEGAVTAQIGSLYCRKDGGAGTTFYVKQSGSGNTGWVGK